jgi:hypothetical protein
MREVVVTIPEQGLVINVVMGAQLFYRLISHIFLLRNQMWIRFHTE